ncbi:MAG TPA: Hsp70 family protein, partial [Planctomycetota bacterium]|nr:Hsp70 family protein [Planctomycetota bacterium]
KVDIIANSDNERITPSVILFEEDEVIVGKIAKNQSVSNPENVVQFIKRHMGEPDWVRVINGREYTPEILSAIILKRIVSDAEDQIGESITDVVITCPAYFNDAERKATQDSGKIAGLNVIGILNEPTAAAIAYGMNNLDKKVKALVYDLGGGTFDVTILEIEGNNIKVLATDGERRLGGKDWDDMLLNHVAEKFIEEHGIDPREDLESYQDLVNKVEEAKKALSKKPKTNIFAQCAGKSSKINISVEQFEEMTKPLLDQTETYLEVVLKKANLQWSDIDVMLMVGGSSRMPMVPRMLKRVTGKDPEKGVNPDECVAVGAAYWAAILLVREAEQLKEKVEAGTASAEEAQKAEASAHKVEEAIPEEVVGMLQGVVVQNVNSHSLGIVTVKPDGKKANLIMIKEQTPLPAQVTKIFGTFMDNQVSVEIKILEGEAPDPDDCTEIGTCIISDLPANRPKGSKVAVTYKYGEDGRIEVLAKDYASGQEAHTEIKREGVGFSDEQITEKAEDIRVLFEGNKAEGEEAAPAAAHVDPAAETLTSEAGGGYFAAATEESPPSTDSGEYPAAVSEAPADGGYAADAGYVSDGAGTYAHEGDGADGYATHAPGTEEAPAADAYSTEEAPADSYSTEASTGEAAPEGEGASDYAAAPAGDGADGSAEYSSSADYASEQPAADGSAEQPAADYAAEPGSSDSSEEGVQHHDPNATYQDASMEMPQEGQPAEGEESGDQNYAAQDYAEGEEGGFADSAEYR